MVLGKSSVSCTYRLGFLYWYPSDITQYLTFVSGYFLIRLISFDTEDHDTACSILIDTAYQKWRSDHGCIQTGDCIKNTSFLIPELLISLIPLIQVDTVSWYDCCWYDMIHLWYITIRIWYYWYSISQWTWGAFVIRHGMWCDTSRYYMIRCMISPLE